MTSIMDNNNFIDRKKYIFKDQLNILPIEQKIYRITTDYITSTPAIKYKKTMCDVDIYNKLSKLASEYDYFVKKYIIQKKNLELLLMQICEMKIKRTQENGDRQYHIGKKNYKLKQRELINSRTNIDYILERVVFYLNLI